MSNNKKKCAFECVSCAHVLAYLFVCLFVYLFGFQSAELLQVYGGQNDMIFTVHMANGRVRLLICVIDFCDTTAVTTSLQGSYSIEKSLNLTACHEKSLNF